MVYYFSVLAFAGAPASFPVQLENRELQRYLKWNKEMSQAANTFIKTKLPKGGFIGIHLRNGIDWVGQYFMPTFGNSRQNIVSVSMFLEKEKVNSMKVICTEVQAEFKL